MSLPGTPPRFHSVSPSKDFFISYARPDEESARWIVRVLEGAGYTTQIDERDFRAARVLVREIEEKFRTCRCFLAVLSPRYLRSPWTRAEWETAVHRGIVDERYGILPVEIVQCDPPPLLNNWTRISLEGLDKRDARDRLLQAAGHVRKAKRRREAPSEIPPLPGSVEPAHDRLPGTASPARATPTRSVLAHVQERVQSNRDPDLLLYTLYGIGPDPAQAGTPGFATVYYLWADADGSSISVRLEKRGPRFPERAYFAVSFHNAPRTYPSNVAFRPGGMSGLDNASSAPGPNNAGKRYLCFEARRSPSRGAASAARRTGARMAGGGSGQRTGQPLSAIALGYRVVDRLGTHWMWGTGTRAACIERSTWEPFHIDLADRSWSVFYPDGNARYAAHQPDFSLIVAVVLEFGSDQGEGRRPGEGGGIVHLRNFHLRDTRLGTVGEAKPRGGA